ncbi:hypothetical protein HEQ63_05170 [Haematospirillum jordaniae]|nr:hypothetical protein [Haematospirillum jordaniae]
MVRMDTSGSAALPGFGKVRYPSVCTKRSGSMSCRRGVPVILVHGEWGLLVVSLSAWAE